MPCNQEHLIYTQLLTASISSSSSSTVDTVTVLYLPASWVCLVIITRCTVRERIANEEMTQINNAYSVYTVFSRSEAEATKCFILKHLHLKGASYLRAALIQVRPLITRIRYTQGCAHTSGGTKVTTTRQKITTA